MGTEKTNTSTYPQAHGEDSSQSIHSDMLSQAHLVSFQCIMPEQWTWYPSSGRTILVGADAVKDNVQSAWFAWYHRHPVFRRTTAFEGGSVVEWRNKGEDDERVMSRMVYVHAGITRYIVTEVR